MKARLIAVLLALVSAFGITVAVTPAANAAVLGCYQGYTNETFGPNKAGYYNRGNWCISRDNQRAQFVFQGDGNLVLYRSGAPVWASNTAGRGQALYFQADGNMVIYDSSWRALWSSGTNQAGYNNQFRNLSIEPGTNSVFLQKWSPKWGYMISNLRAF